MVNPPNMVNPPDRRKNLEMFYGMKEIHRNWGWFLAVGIALIVLGTLAIGAATLVTLASMVFFGTLILIGGIVQTVNAFRIHRGSGFFLSLLAGILYFIIGLLLILHPVVGAITVTLLLAAFYSVNGLVKIIASLTNRFAHWGWTLFSGIVSLLLGILIWSQWPSASLWVIGLFIGIDLLIAGWMWVAISLSAKNQDFDTV